MSALEPKDHGATVDHLLVLPDSKPSKKTVTPDSQVVAKPLLVVVCLGSRADIMAFSVVDSVRGEERMPRRPRVFIEGGIYHVYNRFSRGADVFRGAEEAERFLSLLRTARDRDGVTVFAWCVMSVAGCVKARDSGG